MHQWEIRVEEGRRESVTGDEDRMGWDKPGAEASMRAEASRPVWHDGKWGMRG